MGRADEWKKELKKLEEGKSKYEWDEIEELVTDELMMASCHQMNLIVLWGYLWKLIVDNHNIIRRI